MVDAGELAVTTADNTHRALTWNIQTSKFCTYKQRCGAGTFLKEPGHFCRSRFEGPIPAKMEKKQFVPTPTKRKFKKKSLK